MAIIINLDVMMAKRKISLGELAEKVGITQANLSILKTGKAKAIRFSTLEYKKQEDMINVPLYLAGQIKRLGAEK